MAPVVQAAGAATKLKYKMFVHTVLYVFQIKDVSQFIGVLWCAHMGTMQVSSCIALHIIRWYCS